MSIDTLTIVGVGLIGGSIGLAARRRGLARHILGTGRNRESLDRAVARGAVDEGFLDFAAAVRRADVAVFCTPVDRIAEQVLTAAPLCRAGTLLTDAGSTKAAIVRRIEDALIAGVAFVGSHPLAGSEKRGPDNADEALFEGRLTVVTRTPKTDPGALERTVAFWRALGSRARIMSPEEHDVSLAVTSHLPHLLASALAGLLPAELHDLTATGFRDTTRVAAGDPALWNAVFTQNRAAVLEALTLLEKSLGRYRTALETANVSGLEALLTHAKKVRDALGG